MDSSSSQNSNKFLPLAPGAYRISNGTGRLRCVTYRDDGGYIIHTIWSKEFVIVTNFVVDKALNFFIKNSFTGQHYNSYNVYLPDKCCWVSSNEDVRKYTILHGEQIVYRYEPVLKDTLCMNLVAIEKLNRFSGKKKKRNLGTKYPGKID